MKKIILSALYMSSLVFILLSCSNDTVNEPKSGVNVGTLKLQVTDAPFPFSIVEEANVTLSQIEVRYENEEGSYEIIYDIPTTFNLLELRNGITEELPQALLGVGRYDIIRIIVSEAVVLLKSGELFNLKIPSGSQTGIKINLDQPIEIEPAKISTLLLDFDLSKSFVVQGNVNSPNGFIFKPVIRVANVSSTGSVNGIVQNESSRAIGGAEIKILAGDEEYSTVTNSDGSYEVMGLPAGICSISADMEGFSIISKSDIEVIVQDKVQVDFILLSE